MTELLRYPKGRKRVRLRSVLGEAEDDAEAVAAAAAGAAAADGAAVSVGFGLVAECVWTGLGGCEHKDKRAKRKKQMRV